MVPVSVAGRVDRYLHLLSDHPHLASGFQSGPVLYRGWR